MGGFDLGLASVASKAGRRSQRLRHTGQVVGIKKVEARS